MAGEAVSKTGSDTETAGQGGPKSPLRALAQFHRDPRYTDDLHRADMAWARRAAAMGLCAAGMRAEIMRVRDLLQEGEPETPARVCRADR